MSIQNNKFNFEMIICNTDDGTTNFIHVGALSLFTKLKYGCNRIGENTYVVKPKSQIEFLQFLQDTNIGRRTDSDNFDFVCSISTPSTKSTYPVAFDHVLTHFIRNTDANKDDYNNFISAANKIRARKIKEDQELSEFISEFITSLCNASPTNENFENE